MRWLAFIVIAIICVTLHTTVGARLAVWGVRPDWIVVTVVFFAMHVRGLEAVSAGWILGFLADVHSVERFGLLSLTYAMAAGGVYLVREGMFRGHPLTHLAVTFVAACFVHGILWTYYVLAAGVGGGSWPADMLTVLLIAAYSALWAPVLQAGLLKLSPWLGLERSRYTHAGLTRAGR